MFKFEVTSKCSYTNARAGFIETSSGFIETPVFMPVGTLATIKSISVDELIDIGCQIILSNTYHLYLRPGCDIINLFSGIHNFMNWHRPVLTDSGGFQIFSLAKLNKITEEGAFFQSHIDGSRHFITPEKAIEIQLCLDSDIMMCLDNCIPYPADLNMAKDSVNITSHWASRCKTIWSESKNALFGIVQGGMYKDLRQKSLESIIEIDFYGYALGGLSVGEPKELMLDIASFSLPKLPYEKPKYVMGVGTPDDLIELVGLGADMFDCVIPTRNARNGQLFTKFGIINISNSCHTTDKNPIESGCECYTCRNYSRAYLRHLFINRELLSYRLNTIHNIFYFINFMGNIRNAIIKGTFNTFKNNFYSNAR